MMNKNTAVISKKVFTYENSVSFAKFSGDKNPIHIDPIRARKTISGECIAHGVNSLLWAIDSLIKISGKFYKNYSARFINPIILNEYIMCELDPGKNQIRITQNSIDILSMINFSESINVESFPPALMFNINKSLISPIDNQLNGIDRSPTESVYGGDKSIGKELYPSLNQKVGEDIIYEISTLSNIVGMQVPGLNSLLYRCNISVVNNDISPNYHVSEFDKRFKMACVEYKGRNINSMIESFVRPTSTPSLDCEDIRKRLKGMKPYKGRKFLIIGGSRGIGASVCKVLGLLGGAVTITYAVSRNDAHSVYMDINNNGDYKPLLRKFDVNIDNYNEVLDGEYDDLLYFATPKIFGYSSGEFQHEKYERFRQVYCVAFQEIAKAFIDRGGKTIFYPSTIALEQKKKDLREYAKAKKEGEDICTELGESYKVKVLVRRFDRIDTDQTLSVVSVPAMDPIDIAIDIVKKYYQ